MYCTLAAVLALAASALAAPHTQGVHVRSAHSEIALAKRNCSPMPSKVDPAMRDEIYRVVKAQTDDPKIMIITMVTAYRESMINNLDCGDQDSLGLFQQRPSMGWGSPKELQTPSYAIKKFLSALAPIYKTKSGLEAGVLAQMVQGAEAGNKYTENVNKAKSLIEEARKSVGDSGSNNNDGKPSSSSKPTSTKTEDKPKPTEDKPENGGAINVGGSPAPAPTSTPDDDDTDCDDSLPPCTEYYVPKKGDNCYKVANKFGLKLNQLFDLNPELDQACQHLYAGQKYCVNADDVKKN